jgi:hypothetical protein
MDAQTEMLMAAIATLRSDMQVGFGGVNARLDKLNGQVLDHAQRIAVQEERTDGMVCAEHSATFRQLKRDVAELRKPSQRSTVITSGSVAGLVIVLQGVWAWWQGRQ